MTIEIRELTQNELESVSGAGGGWDFVLGVVGNAVWDALKGEVNGEGFVAQAVQKAKGK